MPLTTTAVFGRGWSAHHRPVSRGSMTAVCEVIDRTAGPPASLDEADAGEQIVARGVPCRVQELNRSGEGLTQAPGQDVTTRDYLIVVPMETPVRWQTGDRGHLVRITGTAEDGDPMLVGRAFDVMQAMTGSEVWERDLVCIDNQTQNREASVWAPTHLT